MPGNQTIADIVLRWTTDQKSQKETIRAIELVEKAISGIGKSFVSSSGKIFTREEIKNGEEILKISQELKISIEEASYYQKSLGKFSEKTTDELLEQVVAYNEIAEAAKVAEEEARKIREEQEKSVGLFDKLLQGVGGFTLIRLGRELDRVGKAILSPISAFVEAQGETTAEGIRWFEATQSLSMGFRGKDTIDSMIAEPAMGIHDKQ